MAWTKAKTAIVVGASVLLAAGTATVTVKEIQEHKTYSWQVLEPENVNLLMKTTPPEGTVLPTKFPREGGYTALRENGKSMGINCSALDVLRIAFSMDSDFLPNTGNSSSMREDILQ